MGARPKSDYWFWNGLYKCKKCPHSSKVAKELVTHVKSHQVKEEKKQDPLNPVGASDLSSQANDPLTKTSFRHEPSTPKMKQTNKKSSTNISYRDGLFMCKRCPYTSREAGTLRDHIKLHNEVAPNPSLREVREKNKKLICDICNQIFSDFWVLQRHKRSVHLKIRAHKCDKCEYAGTRLEHLKKHKISAHNMTANSVLVNSKVEEDPLAITGSNDCESEEGEKQPSPKSSLFKSQKLELHKCNLCELSFCKKSSMYNHKYRAHFNVKECKVLLPQIKGKFEGYERCVKDRRRQKEGRLPREKNHNINYAEIKEMGKEAEMGISDSEIETDQKAKETLHRTTDFKEPIQGTALNMECSGGITCSQCGFSFPAKEELKTHLKASHPETYYMFQVMSDEISQGSKINRLESQENEDSSLHRPQEAYVLKHKEDAPLQQKKESLTTRTVSNGKWSKSQCPECLLTFSNLDTHLRNIHSEYYEERSRKSEASAEVNEDDKKDHNLNEDFVTLDANGCVVWKCGICDYSSAEQKNLKFHIKTIHNGIKDFNCDTCGLFFAKKSSILLHKRKVHQYAYKNVCDQCEYVSSEKSKIDIHKRAVHEKIKDQVCDVCGKAFSHSQTMRRHKRIVHGNGKVKDYVCNLCEYAVSSKLMLTLHNINVHGKEQDMKYYICEVCGYKSYEKTKVDIHRRAVHDKIKSYICYSCNTAFAHSQTLNRHIRTQHPENAKNTGSVVKVEGDQTIVPDTPQEKTEKIIKAWVCDMCGYVAGQKSGLIEHVHSIHWNDKNIAHDKKVEKNVNIEVPWEESVTRDVH